MKNNKEKRKNELRQWDLIPLPIVCQSHALTTTPSQQVPMESKRPGINTLCFLLAILLAILVNLTIPILQIKTYFLGKY